MLPSPVAILSFLASTFADHANASPISSNQVSGSPSTLNWAPCELDFPKTTKDAITGPVDCATLNVPLDYTRPNSSETLALQLIRHNATKEPFKGSIIFNPGGPGVSGVEEVARLGPKYRDVFGGNYNIIGFDTRGTGETIPFACDLSTFNDTREITEIPSIRSKRPGLPQLDLYEILKNKAWDDGKWYAEACAATEGNEEIGRFLGTAFVARDMLQIVDALNEDGKLRFWGRSYSTDLGQTFAAMFPDRIDKMILDSVQKVNDYWTGSWQTATYGTEVALDNFFQECITAGPEFCPGIANFTGANTTLQNLKDALADSLNDLIEQPIFFPEEIPTGLGWWRPGGLPSFLDIKYRLLQFNYRPDQWPTLYLIVQPLLAKNWAAFTEVPPQNSTEAPGEIELPWNKGLNNFHGIGCADGSFRTDTQEDFYSMIQAQQAEGSFSDAFSPQAWVCAHWPFKAAERYEGRFENINTSFPILFVNTANDPITPLDYAFETASGFLGSRLLVQNSHGHGIMNHPSNCTIQALHDYMTEGTLPEAGAVCEPNETGFEYLTKLLAEGGGEGGGLKRSMESPAGLMQGAVKKAKRDRLHLAPLDLQ
ncbi:putative hydrolases or acyltransferase [Aaosphaeria arxii CBS 175.79]|uniref:Putative hydrolases or acyltransferase n=1 Tax=Aaosphaeria arxii CBS 175.79 TaxID=1450172 RepID=A0A6A5YBE4_9PLEO|nr:putative hydrolases or acyltransferase [Aaosphaeria arxii CBS 175.79]KAF2022357.1 putative hydrolases or acyltransferase [Aaosphaeria arxii CBS 175.79]